MGNRYAFLGLGRGTPKICFLKTSEKPAPPPPPPPPPPPIEEELEEKTEVEVDVRVDLYPQAGGPPGVGDMGPPGVGDMDGR